VRSVTANTCALNAIHRDPKMARACPLTKAAERSQKPRLRAQEPKRGRSDAKRRVRAA